MNYFPLHEQYCKHCQQGGLRASMLDRLNLLRSIRNKPTELSSAYRCSVHNQMVSSTGFYGPHTTGRAADIHCSGAQAREVLFAAVLVSAVEAGVMTMQQAQQALPAMLKAGFTGIGLAQKGDHGSRFVHLDDLADADTAGPRPWTWTY